MADETPAPPEPNMLQQFQHLRSLASIVTQRAEWAARAAGLTYNGSRDMGRVLGYKAPLTSSDYRLRYERGGISGRIVEVFPKATWRGSVEVLEDEDATGTPTAFEKEWQALDKRLQVQAKLQKVDILSQLSTYACLLIGAEGDIATELPKGKGQECILYLQPYLGGGGPRGTAEQKRSGVENCITIDTLETDTTNARYGLPVLYRMVRTDMSGSFELTGKKIHYTRILHIADNSLDIDIYGMPALERVWNLLDDLDKVTGGGAEAFWNRANQGINFKMDKDLELPEDAIAAREAMRAFEDMAQEYSDGLKRFIKTRGVDVQTLGSDVANFGPQADAILTQIAGAKGIPKRILTGSEMGELASSQDRENWKDQIDGRQTLYAGPYILRPFVSRLIEYGYLPPPAGGPEEFLVKWPHVQAMTEQERAAGAKDWATVNATQGAPVFTDDEIRQHWYGLDPLTPEQKKLPAQEQGSEPPSEPELTAAAEHESEPEFVRLLAEAVRCNNLTVVDAILGTDHGA